MAAKISEQAATKLFLKNKLQPMVPFPGTQKPWKSKCLVTGKIVSPTYGKVRDFGHRCRYCSGFTTDETDAKALMKLAGFKTLAPYPGGNKPWKSQCLKCKKIFSPNFTSVKLGFGCKYCARRAVDPKDAVTAMKARGFKTLGPFPGATKPWKVQCLKCKKVFNTKFHSLKTANSCKFCRGVALDEANLLKKLKDLKLKPLEKFKSAKTPWKCKCLVCGHIIQPTWMRIRSGRGHCAYCSQRRVDIPMALKFMKSLKLRPITDFPGSNVPWKCICMTCKSECQPRWSGLRRGQGGCSTCAEYGLNFALPGYLYLITHPELRAHKIGIANNYKAHKTDDRVYKHQKQGWKKYKQREFRTVQEASEIETAILKWLRMEVNLPFFLTAREMPQGGWTETVSASEIELVTIWNKVEELAKVKL